MFEQDVVKPGYIFGYILSILALSWGTLALTTSGLLPRATFGIIPFVPGILALIFLSLEGHPIEVHAWPLLRPVTIPAVIFAVVYPLALIGLSAFVALGTGLGYLNGGAGTGIPAGLILATSAFIYAIPASIGQEYGYRGYLLPALTYWQGRVAATLSVGIIWGLVLAPVSYLAMAGTGAGDPFSVALFGSLFTVAVAFAFSCCYYLSENILPVALMNILLILALPAFFSGSWNTAGAGSGGLIAVTWPTPLPLLLLVAMAFVPVFFLLFPLTEDGAGGDSL
jgi:membrane protease YdiL (CAAX protease family)